MRKNVVAVGKTLGHIKKVKSTEGSITTLVITTRGICMTVNTERKLKGQPRKTLHWPHGKEAVCREN